MKTKITQDLDEAIALLREGEVVAFPTETVYGLGASIFRPGAVEKIFIAKGRPSDNPLIAHVFSVEQALSLVKHAPKAFFLLVEKFWPGPLTLVLERKESVPAILSAGQKTIAIRMPNHKVARAILEGVGEPLAAPSANLSGRPSPTSAGDVWEDLEGRIPLIVDGGRCTIGIESTVLSLVHATPTLLRPGSIGVEALEEVLGCKVNLGGGKEPILSPGMKYQHYAPKAKIRLVLDLREIEGTYVLAREKIPGALPLNAHSLYGSFREADRMGVSLIEVYCDSSTLADAALMDRLSRAASKNA